MTRCTGDQIKAEEEKKEKNDDTHKTGAKIRSCNVPLISRHPISNDAVIDFATSYPKQLAAQE